MALNFSGIDSISKQTTPAADPGASPLPAEPPVIHPQPPKETASERGRRLILKGLSAGVDELVMLSFTCSILAELTGDVDFREAVAAIIECVYGGLEYVPYSVQLDGVHMRQRRLEGYLSRSDIPPERREIAERALDAHRRENDLLRLKLKQEQEQATTKQQTA